MLKSNKSFLLSISFFLITLSFVILTLFLVLITNSKIKIRNTLLSNDIQKYYFFDNKLNFPQYEILPGYFDKSFFIDGTVKDISNTINSKIIFYLDVKDYFDDEKRNEIFVGNKLDVSTVFGNFEAEITEIGDIVVNNKVEFTATFNNSTIKLLKGMNVSSKIYYGKYENVIAVPKDFVYQDNSLFYVYKLNNKVNEYEKIFVTFHEELKIQQLYIISNIDITTGDIIIKVK